MSDIRSLIRLADRLQNKYAMDPPRRQKDRPLSSEEGEEFYNIIMRVREAINLYNQALRGDSKPSSLGEEFLNKMRQGQLMKSEVISILTKLNMQDYSGLLTQLTSGA